MQRIDKPSLFVNRSGPGAEAVAATLKKDLPAAQVVVMDNVPPNPVGVVQSLR